MSPWAGGGARPSPASLHFHSSRDRQVLQAVSGQKQQHACPGAHWPHAAALTPVSAEAVGAFLRWPGVCGGVYVPHRPGLCTCNLPQPRAQLPPARTPPPPPVGTRSFLPAGPCMTQVQDSTTALLRSPSLGLCSCLTLWVASPARRALPLPIAHVPGVPVFWSSRGRAVACPLCSRPRQIWPPVTEPHAAPCPGALHEQSPSVDSPGATHQPLLQPDGAGVAAALVTTCLPSGDVHRACRDVKSDTTRHKWVLCLPGGALLTGPSWSVKSTGQALQLRPSGAARVSWVL